MKLSLPFQQILVSIGIAILVRSCPTFILFGTRSEKSSAVRDTEFNFRRDIHSIRFPFGCVSLTTALSAKSQRTNASFIWRVISKNALCLYHKPLSPTYDTFGQRAREKNKSISFSAFLFPLVLFNNSTSASILSFSHSEHCLEFVFRKPSPGSIRPVFCFRGDRIFLTVFLSSLFSVSIV